METGYERLDPPASPDLRLVELAVELGLAEVAAAVAPELGLREPACFRLALAFLSRCSAHSLFVIRPLNDERAVHFHVGSGLGSMPGSVWAVEREEGDGAGGAIHLFDALCHFGHGGKNPFTRHVCFDW